MATIPKNQLELEEFLKKAEIAHFPEVNAKIVIFPTLWSIDKSKRFRYWNMYV